MQLPILGGRWRIGSSQQSVPHVRRSWTTELACSAGRSSIQIGGIWGLAATTQLMSMRHSPSDTRVSGNRPRIPRHGRAISAKTRFGRSVQGRLQVLRLHRSTVSDRSTAGAAVPREAARSVQMSSTSRLRFDTTAAPMIVVINAMSPLVTW